MNKFLLLQLLFVLIYKSHFAQDKPDSLYHTASDTSYYSSLLQSEVLNYADIRINGKLGFLNSTKKLRRCLKRPDSIIASTMECGAYFDESDVYIYSFGGSSFEVKADTAVIRTINFADGRLFLVTPAISLRKYTTLEEIKMVFPIACKNISTRKDERTGALLEEVTLQASFLPVDCWWIMTFQGGKLIELHYYIPC